MLLKIDIPEQMVDRFHVSGFTLTAKVVTAVSRGDMTTYALEIPDGGIDIGEALPDISAAVLLCRNTSFSLSIGWQGNENPDPWHCSTVLKVESVVSVPEIQFP